MATELVKVVGLAKYPRLFEHNRDRGSQEGVNGAKYTYPEATSLDLIVDQEELSALSKANPKLKPRITEDGISIRLRRKWVATVPSRGGPPHVVDEDGNPWDPNVNIGNGSKVEVYVEVYDTNYGKAMRLKGVRVLDLVPFESSEDDISEEDLPEWLRTG